MIGGNRALPQSLREPEDSLYFYHCVFPSERFHLISRKFLNSETQDSPEPFKKYIRFMWWPWELLILSTLFLFLFLFGWRIAMNTATPTSLSCHFWANWEGSVIAIVDYWSKIDCKIQKWINLNWWTGNFLASAREFCRSEWVCCSDLSGFLWMGLWLDAVKKGLLFSCFVLRHKIRQEIHRSWILKPFSVL